MLPRAYPVKLPRRAHSIYRARVRRWLPLLALCLGCTVAARAQAPDLGEARRLFAEGVAQARAGAWELALSAFQAAYALAPQPSVLFNLASAQLRAGKLLASNANYRRFAGEAGVSPAARRVAEAQIAHIEQRIPRLRIDIEGLRAGDRISLDEARVYPDELGHDMWLDPGVHTVRVDRPRGDQEIRSIAVAEGQIRVLALRLP